MYSSVAELPETPELVIVAVAAPLVRGVLEQCGEKGVAAVVVVSAGFSELGPEGRAREDELIETATRYGMVLVGPNCMGVISSHHKLYGTGFTLLRPEPGGASMVSQSGNLGIQLLTSAERRKGGVGKFVGVGNEAMIDVIDFINYLRTDPETNTIVAYMEGFDDGRRLFEVTRETSLEKPVVILRGGTSEYGKRAAASHTGALASSTAVFSAAARQSGMIVTTDPDEFMDLTFALSYMPLPPGKRVAVATLGGGWGVLVADEIARVGLQMAELDATVIEKLNGILPAYWSHGNPIDLVSTISPGVPEAVVESLVASDSVDAVIVMGVVGALSESRRAVRQVESLQRWDDPATPEIETCPDDERTARAGTERARDGVHRAGGEPDGPLLQAHRQYLLQAHDPGHLLGRGTLLHLRPALAPEGGAHHRQDGRLQRPPTEERPRPELLSDPAPAPPKAGAALPNTQRRPTVAAEACRRRASAATVGRRPSEYNSRAPRPEGRRGRDIFRRQQVSSFAAMEGYASGR